MVPFFYKASVLLILTAMIGLKSCDKASPVDGKGKDLELNPDELEVVARSNQFGFRLYQESLRDLNSDENAMISPLSIQAALAMTWQGAKGTTRDVIAQAIDIDSFDEDIINSYFRKLIADLPLLDPQTRLEIANSIWYRQEFQVIPAFLDVNQQFYKAEINALDFNAASAPEQINSWVRNRTNNKIEKIVERLESDLMMLLINAVYFKGSWEQQFDPAETYQEVFHHGTDAAQVIHAYYMQVEHSFPYLSTADFEAVELPYGNKKYSMVAVLPRENLSVTDLVQHLSSLQSWNETLHQGSLTPRKINLSLPKFKFSYANRLNDELMALGMGEAFSPAADFTGIQVGGQLMISEVNHKTFIEVNEEGTEAAAVTSVGIVLTSAGPQSYNLIFDKPFLFVIREMSSGLILFIGQVNNPESENTDLI